MRKWANNWKIEKLKNWKIVKSVVKVENAWEMLIQVGWEDMIKLRKCAKDEKVNRKAMTKLAKS